MGIDRKFEKRQIIVLETIEGSATDEDDLRHAWEERLKDCGATNYKIKSVAIMKNTKNDENNEIIKNRRKEIERLQKEITDLENEEKEESFLLTEQRIATILHRELCTGNHIDICAWEYEKSWDESAHKKWLDMAKKISKIGISIEQVKEIAEILKSI